MQGCHIRFQPHDRAADALVLKPYLNSLLDEIELVRLLTILNHFEELNKSKKEARLAHLFFKI
jgi:hypothetical protein